MRGYWLVILAFLLLPFIHAAQLDVRYDAGATTHVTYTFTHVNEPLTVPLPHDVRTATINNNQTPTQQTITLETDTNLTFSTSALTRQRGYFAADLGRIDATINEVVIYLPEGARLQRALTSSDPSIKPTPTDAFTDGKHLIFIYTGASLEPARAIIIDYETTLPGPRILFATAGALILAGLLILLAGRRPTRDKGITRNLYREEKQLVELLLQAPDNELWQKELTKQSGLSNVKASRKIRNLEAKEVIEKIPHGNTNKIRLKRSE